MAKNLSRKFATMSEDERRRFALQEEEGSPEHPSELAFEEPRDEPVNQNQPDDKDT